MNYSEIKIKLFQQIDSVKNDRLIELYGVVSNFINNVDNSEEWDKLTVSQQKGLEYGLSELDEGKGIDYKMVMEDLMKKYGIS
jgi:signal transduction histidine kinase